MAEKNKFRPLENIVRYFSDLKQKRIEDNIRSDQEYELHKKKTLYIDSLQSNIELVLKDTKTVISDHNKVDGYYVALGDKSYDTKLKTDALIPNITIRLEAEHLNDMVLKVYDKSMKYTLLECTIKNETDFNSAKESITDYVSTLFGIDMMDRGEIL